MYCEPLLFTVNTFGVCIGMATVIFNPFFFFFFFFYLSPDFDFFPPEGLDIKNFYFYFLTSLSYDMPVLFLFILFFFIISQSTFLKFGHFGRPILPVR